MKALSTKQPWAWLIVHGYKGIENKTRGTRLREEILIHTGLRPDKAGDEWVRKTFPEIPLPPLAELPLGGVVGRATITGVCWESDDPWFTGPVGIILEQAVPMPFVPGKGLLGYFTFVPAEEKPDG